MQWFMEAVQPYLQTVVLALFSIIASLVVAALVELRTRVLSWFYAHTNAANQKYIEGIAKEAYAYAERFFINKKGDEKLNAAINYAMRKINLHTIGLTREDIEGALQKAWQDYNQYGNQTKPGDSEYNL